MSNTAFQDSLLRGLHEIGFEISPRQLDSFCLYNDLLLDWNRTTNLTSITDLRDVAIKHFVDSATVLKYRPDWTGTKLVDVGSGAGFPGLVMKLLEPGLSLALIDVSRKRAAFLRKVITELGISGARILAQRAETWGHRPGFREQFDVATARALGTLPVAVELVLPLVRVGGCFLSQKGAVDTPEIEQAKRACGLLGGEVSAVSEFDLPILKDHRSVVTVTKTKSTPGSYPRAPGIPEKRPLGGQ